MKNSILVAVGGNSLIRAGQRGTIAEQRENARLTAECIAGIVARGYSLVVTHGNGPQVGAQLLRSEAGSSQTYTLPLDICVAMTQGEIGFMLQNSMQMTFRKLGINRSVVTVVTQVVVDKNDPAFQRPTKPIGPFYSKETAERKRKELGWSIIEDAARGYRRVVASPLPKDIVELEVIKGCLERNIVVITVGGGGIPVIYEGGEVKGMEAVIDKDRASALLAAKLGIEHFIISTEVPEVYINYKRPNQQKLRSITVAETKKHFADGQFSEGSMRPKIEAAMDFLNNGGKIVTITDPEHLITALDGEAGTRIIK
ncbi:MAG: carbamate kinase [Bacteroidota bacterium]